MYGIRRPELPRLERDAGDGAFGIEEILSSVAEAHSAQRVAEEVAAAVVFACLGSAMPKLAKQFHEKIFNLVVGRKLRV
jgi:hypothetical protein